MPPNVITNEVIYTELKAWKEEDLRKHTELKEDIKEVKKDVKEFSSLCQTRRSECSGNLHSRINAISDVLSRLNGKLGNGSKPNSEGHVYTRKNDWAKENWKVLGLIVLLAGLAGNRIVPIARAIFGF